MIARPIAIVIAGIALATCTTAGSAEIPGCRTGPCVRIGETQEMPTISATPEEVLTDSRCPIEAECAWAGELKLKTRLDMGHETIWVELHASQPLRINGGMLTLAEVAPDASSQWPELQPEDYAFRFTFAPDISDRK